MIPFWFFLGALVLFGLFFLHPMNVSVPENSSENLKKERLLDGMYRTKPLFMGTLLLDLGIFSVINEPDTGKINLFIWSYLFIAAAFLLLGLWTILSKEPNFVARRALIDSKDKATAKKLLGVSLIINGAILVFIAIGFFFP